MPRSPLSHRSQRVWVGAPLPFNIRDHDRTLLLARGQVVESVDQMDALLGRGALVDLAELQSPAERTRQAAPQALPGLWTTCLDKLGDTLRGAGRDGVVETLEEHVAPMLALIERDRDLAIVQVLRQEGNALVQSGVNHATPAAITGNLVAQRLGWSADDAQPVFRTGLTMNISMLELHGQLAPQTTPPTPARCQGLLAQPRSAARCSNWAARSTPTGSPPWPSTTRTVAVRATAAAPTSPATWPHWRAVPTSTPPS